jgi:hypothetical protein
MDEAGTKFSPRTGLGYRGLLTHPAEEQMEVGDLHPRLT